MLTSNFLGSFLPARSFLTLGAASYCASHAWLPSSQCNPGIVLSGLRGDDASREEDHLNIGASFPGASPILPVHALNKIHQVID